MSLFLVLSWPSWGQQSCDDPRRIVGGEDADIKEHPWQVGLNVNGGPCGGSIIAQSWVLTAAHCFDFSKEPRNVRVRAGTDDYKKTGPWLTVERVVVHDKYNAQTKENDLALVKLKFRPAGQAIPLANPGQKLHPCEVLEVTGWGRTTEGGTKSDKLQKAILPYIDNATCNEPNSYDGAVLPGMMCAGLHGGGVDACQGDSGGPLVLRGPDGPVLVGVVSWGEGCARKLKYGIYTRISPHRDWINGVILADKK
jgi:secreted trypsin-like serine protease